MKKTAIFFFPSVVFGLYSGNPSEPRILDSGFWIPEDSVISVKAGYEGDLIFDRKLKTRERRVGEFEIGMNQGVVTLGFWDRVELAGSFGSFAAKFWNAPFREDDLFQLETKEHWTAGGNLKAILFEWNQTTLGVCGGYQYAQAPLSRLQVEGVSFLGGGNVTYQEWQVSLGFSHTIDFFTPYLSAGYSAVKSSVTGMSGFWIQKSHFSMENREKFSLIAGATISSGRKFDLNGEVRLFGEEAFTLAANIEF